MIDVPQTRFIPLRDQMMAQVKKKKKLLFLFDVNINPLNTGVCTKCSTINCDLCTLADVCTKCLATYYLYTDSNGVVSCNSCVTPLKVKAGGIAEKTDGTGVCIDCTSKSNCVECDNAATSTVCTKCSTTLIYQIKNGACELCANAIPGCLECNLAGTVCTKCVANTYFLGSDIIHNILKKKIIIKY